MVETSVSLVRKAHGNLTAAELLSTSTIQLNNSEIEEIELHLSEIILRSWKV